MPSGCVIIVTLGKAKSLKCLETKILHFVLNDKYRETVISTQTYVFLRISFKNAFSKRNLSRRVCSFFKLFSFNSAFWYIIYKGEPLGVKCFENIDC